MYFVPLVCLNPLTLPNRRGNRRKVDVFAFHACGTGHVLQQEIDTRCPKEFCASSMDAHFPVLSVVLLTWLLQRPSHRASTDPARCRADLHSSIPYISQMLEYHALKTCLEMETPPSAPRVQLVEVGMSGFPRSSLKRRPNLWCAFGERR